jgi:hypothetical protein
MRDSNAMNKAGDGVIVILSIFVSEMTTLAMKAACGVKVGQCSA